MILKKWTPFTHLFSTLKVKLTTFNFTLDQKKYYAEKYSYSGFLYPFYMVMYIMCLSIYILSMLIPIKLYGFLPVFMIVDRPLSSQLTPAWQPCRRQRARAGTPTLPSLINPPWHAGTSWTWTKTRLTPWWRSRLGLFSRTILLRWVSTKNWQGTTTGRGRRTSGPHSAKGTWTIIPMGLWGLRTDFPPATAWTLGQQTLRALTKGRGQGWGLLHRRKGGSLPE